MFVFKTGIHHWPVIACVLLLVGALGCGGGYEAVPDTTVADDQSVATEPAGLPAVADLQAGRTASADPVTYRDGLDFAPDLPHQHFENRLFTPETHPEEPWEFADYACAGYRFNVTGATVEPILKMNWEVYGYPAVFTGEPRLYVQVWIAMANWDKERWDWVTRDYDGSVYLEDLAPYTADDGTVLVFYVVSGYNDMITLNSLQLGSSHPVEGEWTSYQPSIEVERTTMVLEVDGEDRPVIASGLYNPIQGSYVGAALATLTGDAFEVEYVNTGCSRTNMMSLAFNAAAEPRFVYYDRIDSYFIAARDGLTWTNLEIPSGYNPRSIEGFYISSEGDPTLALYSDHNLYIGDYNGTEWSIEPVAEGITYIFGLKQDAGGNPCVGFLQAGLPYLSRHNAGAWETEQVWDQIIDNAELAVDAAGNLQFSVIKPTTGIEGELLHAGWTGTAWETSVIVPEHVSSLFIAPAIDMLGNGNPVVAYNNEDTLEILLAIFDGTDWQLESVALHTSRLTLDLAVDSQDRIWLLEEDYSGVLNLHCREPVF